MSVDEIKCSMTFPLNVILHGFIHRQIQVKLYRGYENEHSNSEYIKDAKWSDICKFMMGMSYEQFKYQNLAWTYQNFSRNYHILLGSSKINRDKIIDINEITKKCLI